MPQLPGSGNLWQQMRDTTPRARSGTLRRRTWATSTRRSPVRRKTVSATYKYPYNGAPADRPELLRSPTSRRTAHASSRTRRTRTRSAPASRRVLGLRSNQVRVSYYEGSSVYGNAPYDDCAEAAALMSQLVGAPVRLQFMRWDEHGWDNYGPPQLMDVRGGVDANGQPRRDRHDDLRRSRGTRRRRPRRCAGLPAARSRPRRTSTRRTTARSTT